MTQTTAESHYIGIDVSTGSVRASLVTKSGKTVASSTHETTTWRDRHDHRSFEQSTTDIWDGGRDHRAEEEAEFINGTGSIMLDYLGGKMSLEMEIPKNLWLKNNMDPSRFSNRQFFDLPDFLTYKATTDSSRSFCSLTCKCSYVPNAGWQKDFFNQIGLNEPAEREYAQVGAAEGDLLIAWNAGGQRPYLRRLRKSWAYSKGPPYAGWLGTVAARYEENGKVFDIIPTVQESGHRLTAVAGTSTCHIVQSPEGIFVEGVWGPYKDPILSGWWMNEGGQSSTGQLIEFILTTHPAYPELVKMGKDQQRNIHTILEETLEKLRVGIKHRLSVSVSVKCNVERKLVDRSYI
ncbi:hypothetical protein B0H34DRAFT_804443 [Crassisporium funariophilum]|nr:hypothetical protein B0H34DRAFT_804443 [Crassisporium funariophilum]